MSMARDEEAERLHSTGLSDEGRIRIANRWGVEKGEEICKVAKRIGPSDAHYIPLYRSCLVIETENGRANIHAYGDPGWMGHDLNTQTILQEHHPDLACFQGERSGPRKCDEDGE